tara:strand:- start:18414 stop:19577 length:1164 start_codon:yes stop_codon:yes gene_type:complete
MKLAVLGLGFVGTTSMLGFSKLGFEVTGIEKNIKRLDGFRDGKIPFFDNDLQEKFDKNDKIKFIDNVSLLPDDYKDYLICVETPLKSNKLDLSVVENAISEICNISNDVNIWLRSTTDDVEAITKLENKVSKTGNNFFLFPEFMREGSCWNDFFDPAFTILAGNNVTDTKFYKEVANNFKNINSCNLAEAITVKIASNAFHALKVTFANELKYLKQANMIDIQNVMKIFCTDTKLNISSKYLSPGEPFSGPCLKKDTIALSNSLNDSVKEFSVINQIDISNENQINLIINKIENLTYKDIGFYGLEFKKGSGDIRNSYMIRLIKSIRNKNIFIFDDSVSRNELDNVLGSNYQIEDKLENMLNKVDVVFTKFNTSLDTNVDIISLDSL